VREETQSLPSTADDTPVDTLFLSQIVSARYEEIFDIIQVKLVELDRD
jgi:cell division ATPase FtsA